MHSGSVVTVFGSVRSITAHMQTCRPGLKMSFYVIFSWPPFITSAKGVTTTNMHIIIILLIIDCLLYWAQVDWHTSYYYCYACLLLTLFRDNILHLLLLTCSAPVLLTRYYCWVPSATFSDFWCQCKFFTFTLVCQRLPRFSRRLRQRRDPILSSSSYGVELFY